MKKNHFKIAFRAFKRHKLFTMINILGLSIGISAALVIYMIVQYDYSFDKDHKDGDRIYRVVTGSSSSEQLSYNSGVMGPLPEAVERNVTGLDGATPFFKAYSPNVIVVDKENTRFRNQNNIILADKRYFEMFSYNWLVGSSATALNEPNKVVLTSDQAHLYFPSVPYEQIVGRSLIYGDTITTTVTGIVEPLAGNTDLTFHDFISYSTGSGYAAFKGEMSLDQWGSVSPASQFFVKLSPKASADAVEKQLNVLLRKNNPPKADDKNPSEFKLQPLDDLHFNINYGTYSGRTASKSTLTGLLIIGGFLLILGCINFINLTTAQSAQRAKEIGVRKTIGSSRKQLMIQFLSETFLITLFSVIISFICAPLLLRMFADFIPPGLHAGFLYQQDILIFLLLLTITVSFLSGFYPALVLSAGKPLMVIKGRSAEGNTRNVIMRKSLTITQFVIAQFFIMSALLVSKQIYYAIHKDLGFKKEAIIYISPSWDNKNAGLKSVLVEKLRALPQIELVSLGGASPSSDNTHSTGAVYNDGKQEIKTNVQERFGDENYINVYHIKLLAGRNIQPSDTLKGLLINQSYAKAIGFKDPNDAVDKSLTYNGKPMQIVGVVADFYHQSLRTAVKPLVIITSTNKYFSSAFHVALKPQVSGGEWRTAIEGIEKSWKEIYPDDDFNYHFFDESIAQFYESEQRTSTLLSWATGLSILISCLGLLGLAVYTTGQRTKEIGVRKVLGATVTQLIVMLSRELIVLILLAFVIVAPAAWWFMNNWLQSFSDRTTISWWIFAASGGGMILMALFTTIFQTSKAALANPVESLRSE